MNKLHPQSGLELDADYDFCPNCQKAVIGGITADEHGLQHVCSEFLMIETPEASKGPAPATSLSHRQASTWTSLCVLLLLLGNIALTIFSHLGLSASIMTNEPPEKYADQKNQPCVTATNSTSNVTCGTCNATDIEIYYARGQMQGNDALSSTCGTKCASAMFAGVPDCAFQCVMDTAHYSPPCAYCFAVNGVCVVKNCLSFCIQNSSSPGCRVCVNDKCASTFRNGSGLPIGVYDPNNSSWNAPSPALNQVPTPVTIPPSTVPTSVAGELYGVPDYGQISFVYSVKRAYNANARSLAVIIVIASGVWPYLKCMLMFFAWFIPMPLRVCTAILEVVCWLGRFSLVDVLAILVLAVGLDFDLLGGVVQIRTESRGAIVAFGIVAIWALLMSEWMLRNQIVGELRVNKYKGYETRWLGWWKVMMDRLGSGIGLSVLAVICFAIAVAAVAGPGYTFEIDDLTSNSTGVPRHYSLGTILWDVRIVDFPAIVCLLFVIVLPLATPVLVVAWALSGMRPDFGLSLSQCGRMCCMDVFFISSIIFGAEYSELIPSVLNGVSPCYRVRATSHLGFGVALCLVHGVVSSILVLAIGHNVHWTLSPPLPHKIEAKPTDDVDRD